MINQAVALPTYAPTAPLLQQETPVEQLANGLALIVVLVVVGLSLVAFMAVLRGLLPSAVEGSRAALLRSPWRAFFVGLANYLFLGGISLALFSTEAPPLGAVGLVLVVFLVTVTVIGLAGLVMLVGERLAGLQNRPASPFKQLVWGTAATALAGLLPFVGWFLLLPVLLMVAFGAALLAWRNRNRPSAEPATEAPAG